MVKTPHTRHSKSSRQQVTIDLEAEKTAADEAASAGKADAADKKAPAAAAGAPTGANNKASAGADANAETGKRPADTSAPARDAGNKPEGGKEKRADAKTSDSRGRKPVSFAAMVAAGIAGGVIALGGNAALHWAGLAPGASREQTADIASLRDEVANLQSKVGESATTAAEAAKVAAAEAVSTGLEETKAAVTELSGQVDQLRDGLQKAQDALESGAGGDGAALQALKDRIDAIDAKITEAANSDPANPAGDEALRALESELASLKEAIDAVNTGLSSTGELTKANSTAIGDLTGRIDQLAKTVEQQDANPRVALAIAAAALKSAIDRGLPFMSELETYAAVAPGAPEVEALRELAAAGVPTRTHIAASMAGAANKMLAAVSEVPEDAGIFERLMSSAQSLIAVRPIGMVEGETPGAIVARMEVAINSNDYAKALAEYETLPDAARQAGEEFVTTVRARLKADELIDTALAAALRPVNG